MRYVAFQTDLFFTDIPDDQLDHWFVGGDCAGWFYARLLPDIHITDHYGPGMEDWGWTMAVKVDDLVVWINTWQYIDRGQSWILGIEAKKRMFKKVTASRLESAQTIVENRIQAILDADTRFASFGWSNEHPLDTPAMK